MSGHKARKAFRKIGSNFATPEVIKYHDAGNWGIELSTGEIFGTYFWGVSVIDIETNKIVQDIGKLFHSLEEAEDYILDIKRDKQNNK